MEFVGQCPEEKAELCFPEYMAQVTTEGGAGCCQLGRDALFPVPHAHTCHPLFQTRRKSGLTDCTPPHSAVPLRQAQPDAGRVSLQSPHFPRPGRGAMASMEVIFCAPALLGSLVFPHQAGGSACGPPSAMPHSIVLYKQGILAKIQKTLPRKKGKL